MASFNVSYIALNGDRINTTVTADDKSDIPAMVGMPMSMLAIKEANPFFTFSAKKQKKLSIQEQATVLLSTAANIDKGDVPNTALDSALSSYRTKDQTLFPINVDLTLAQNMKSAGFFPFAVQMAEAGEQHGSLSDSLAAAAAYGETRSEQINAIKGPMLMACVYTLLSICVMIGLPLVIGPVAEVLSDSLGDVFKGNLSTAIITGTNSFLRSGGVVFLALPLVLAYVIKKHFHKWNDIPIFSSINQVIWCDRAILVAEAISLLKPKGITPIEIFEFLRSSSNGHTADAYDRVITVIKRGESLHYALEQDLWPAQLVSVMKGLEEINTDQLSKTLESNVRALRQKQLGILKQLSARAGIFATLSVVSIILLVATGFMLPMMGMTSGIRNI